jgi:NADH:ubiquinone oxidoreductase subunit 5 (subunit L)/multisubunit Na+/H+ antiporter MnhA subunit
MVFYFFRTLDFAIVFSLVPYFENVNILILGANIKCLDVISCFLFLGSMGKSAQLGLHT